MPTIKIKKWCFTYETARERMYTMEYSILYGKEHFHKNGQVFDSKIVCKRHVQSKDKEMINIRLEIRRLINQLRQCLGKQYKRDMLDTFLKNVQKEVDQGLFDRLMIEGEFYDDIVEQGYKLYGWSITPKKGNYRWHFNTGLDHSPFITNYLQWYLLPKNERKRLGDTVSRRLSNDELYLRDHWSCIRQLYNTCPNLLIVMAYAIYAATDLLSTNAYIPMGKNDQCKSKDNNDDEFFDMTFYSIYSNADPNAYTYPLFEVVEQNIQKQYQEKIMFSPNHNVIHDYLGFFSEEYDSKSNNQYKSCQIAAKNATEYPLMLCVTSDLYSEKTSLAAINAFLNVCKKRGNPTKRPEGAANELLTMRRESKVIHNKKLGNLPVFFSQNAPLRINDSLIKNLLVNQHMLFPYTYSRDVRVAARTKKSFLPQILQVDLSELPTQIALPTHFNQVMKCWQIALGMFLRHLYICRNDDNEQVTDELIYFPRVPNNIISLSQHGRCAYVLAKRFSVFTDFLMTLVPPDDEDICERDKMNQLLADALLSMPTIDNACKDIFYQKDFLLYKLVCFIASQPFATEYTDNTVYWQGSERNTKEQCYYLRHDHFYRDFSRFVGHNIPASIINNIFKEERLLYCPRIVRHAQKGFCCRC